MKTTKYFSLTKFYIFFPFIIEIMSKAKFLFELMNDFVQRIIRTECYIKFPNCYLFPLFPQLLFYGYFGFVNLDNNILINQDVLAFRVFVCKFHVFRPT